MPCKGAFAVFGLSSGLARMHWNVNGFGAGTRQDVGG